MQSQPYRVIQPEPCSIVALPVPNPSARVARQVLSKDEWEQLKPIIRQLYIEENKTFRKISTILSRSHGFTPTKRQFDARISRWGFRKNTSKEERHKIVTESKGLQALGTNGKIINQKTRERWEKEFQPIIREESGISCGLFNSTPDNTYVRSLFYEISGVGSETYHKRTLNEQSNPRDADSDSDSWPWSSVDVPGSPPLTRLFAALDIHCPSNSIEPLALSEATGVSPTDSVQSFPPTHFDLNSSSGPIATTSGNKYHPDQASRNPSPFLELYPFPTSLPVARRSFVPSTAPNIHISDLRARCDSLQAVLATFSNTLPSGNPVILQSIEELAASLYECGDFEQSETWWRRAFSILQNTGGMSTRRTLSAMNQVYRSMILAIGISGDPRTGELNNLEARLEMQIPKFVSTDDEIALDFLLYKAIRHYNKGELWEAEVLVRQMLQISLSSLGPKDVRATRAMSELGRFVALSISRNSKNKSTTPPYADEEQTVRLARTAVQLHKSAHSLIEEKSFFLINNLLSVLRNLGRVTEAAEFGELVLSKCIPALGEQHYWSMRYMGELGSTLCTLERFPEAIALLQRVIHLRDMLVPDPIEGIGMWYKKELGFAFRGMARHREAIECFETGGWGCIESYVGSLSELMKATLWAYGDSYVQLGEYDATLELYGGYLKALEGHQEGGHRWTGDVRGWIEDVKSVMLRVGGGAGNDEEEFQGA